MTALLLLILLALLLAGLWARRWLRYSKIAVGLAIGATVSVVVGLFASAIFVTHEVPLWLPPLPFAVVAFTMFGLGLLIWFQAKD